MNNPRGKKVKVWVRTRPTSTFAGDIIHLLDDKKTINLHCKRDPKKGVVNNQVLDWSFKLDGVMHNVSQEQIQQELARPVVSQALQGYNGTILCYGQTGAGKTFTMTGATENYKHRGVIPRSISQIFKEIDERSEYAVNIRISYLEIYNETMFDLLSTLPESMQVAQMNPMTIVEDDNAGVCIKGLNCHLAQNEEEALNLLFEGETNRAIAEHSLNKNSSRSHCIFTIYIESRSRVQSEARYTLSKLNFVDLAGSERLGKTKSAGKTQQEAMYINKSLSFLEQTVMALADRRREHVPYRQTKLTHCLKDSIGGNCNTLLIANIWAEKEQIEETISTLRFATRMMCVANEPTVNEQFDPAILVKKLEREIMTLKHELAMHDTLFIEEDEGSRGKKGKKSQDTGGKKGLLEVPDSPDLEVEKRKGRTPSSFSQKGVKTNKKSSDTDLEKSTPKPSPSPNSSLKSSMSPNSYKSNKTNRNQITYEPLSEQQRYEIKSQVQSYIAGALDEIDIVNIRQIQGVYESFKDMCQQMEKEVENKFKSKYTLVDKTDPQAIAAAQAAGLPVDDNGDLVGETDGKGFGIGTSPTAKPAPSSVVNSRKRQAKRGTSKQDRASPVPKGVSPTSSMRHQDGASSRAASGDKKEKEDRDQATPNSTTDAPTGKISKREKKMKEKEREREKEQKDKDSDDGGADSPVTKARRPSSTVREDRVKTRKKSNIIDPDKTIPEGASLVTPEENIQERKIPTPPPRMEAFETFKQEAGSEIYRILVENKDILGSKKKAYSDLAKQINLTKSEIDESRQKLDRMKAEREEQGPMFNEEGDIIITEAEYLEIKRLKDLKAVYRQDFEELKHLKTEVQYCQKLVDTCRQRLIQEFIFWYKDMYSLQEYIDMKRKATTPSDKAEFDNWYCESFLSHGEPDGTSVEAGFGARLGTVPPKDQEICVEDEQEKFDRLQKQLLLEDPDSAPFYNAKMRTQRRKIYETAMSQPQESLIRKRNPGTPTRTLRSKPPTMLQVQY